MQCYIFIREIKISFKIYLVCWRNFLFVNLCPVILKTPQAFHLFCLTNNCLDGHWKLINFHGKIYVYLIKTFIIKVSTGIYFVTFGMWFTMPIFCKIVDIISISFIKLHCFNCSVNLDHGWKLRLKKKNNKKIPNPFNDSSWRYFKVHVSIRNIVKKVHDVKCHLSFHLHHAILTLFWLLIL